MPNPAFPILRLIALTLVLILGACSSTPNRPAPGTTAGGYYTVAPGDTLFSIARRLKQPLSALISLNGLKDKDDIKVGQQLRLSTHLRTDTVTPTPTKRAPVRNAAAGAATMGGEAEMDAVDTEPAPRDWIWPTDGKLSAGFGATKKGIEISGSSGQEVRAANDGKVSFVGGGIRGYGNLVIIKHSGNILSVYAHNKTVLVKEGQAVSKGQKIAEMGDSDSDTVKLYFELRRNGKPVDPAGYLPAR